MPTPVEMDIDGTKDENGDAQHKPNGEATIGIKSPPQVKRKNKETAPTPECEDGAANKDGTNYVTPAKEEQKSARKNKDPKKTKTLDAYFGDLRKKKKNSANTRR